MEVRDKNGRFAKGNTPWTKGRPRPKEIREKISKSVKESPLRWIGPHTKEERKRISIGIKKHWKNRVHPTKGTHISEEHKQKISRGNTGKIFTKEHREKLSIAGSKRVWTEETREKERIGSTGNSHVKIHYKKILKESKRLEKEGFRVVPIGKVVPDIIAFKDNKIYAIEVEETQRGANIKHDKYEKTKTKKFFDDIIWIVREGKK